VAIVLKPGSLNFLEPSGTVKGWNGIALPHRCKYEMRLIQEGVVLFDMLQFHSHCHRLNFSYTTEWNEAISRTT
jgi:hypothetical protein